MADTHQLVFHLLTLGFQLHGIGQRLPPAPATDAKMLAERLQPMLRGLHNAFDEAFHVIFLLFVNLDIHNVSGHGKVDKNHHAVHMRERFAFRGHRLDGHVFQQQIDSFLGHNFLMCCKGRGNFLYPQVNII